MTAESGAKKQRGRPFKKGQSGNPAGKPKGARNKATLAVQALLEGEAEAIGRVAVEKALEGDLTAVRLVLERLLPPAKDRPVNVTLPKMESASDLPSLTAAILAAVGKGDLTPCEGQVLAGIVEKHRQALELAEIEQRLAALEAQAQRGIKL